MQSLRPEDGAPFEKALGDLKDVLTREPRIPRTYALYGELLLEADRAKEAANVFQALVALEEKTFEGHYGLGVALQRLDRPEAAVEVQNGGRDRPSKHEKLPAPLGGRELAQKSGRRGRLAAPGDRRSRGPGGGGSSRAAAAGIGPIGKAVGGPRASRRARREGAGRRPRRLQSRAAPARGRRVRRRSHRAPARCGPRAHRSRRAPGARKRTRAFGQARRGRRPSAAPSTLLPVSPPPRRIWARPMPSWGVSRKPPPRSRRPSPAIPTTPRGSGTSPRSSSNWGTWTAPSPP